MIRFASALVLATLFAAPVAAQSTEIDPRRFSVMGDPNISQADKMKLLTGLDSNMHYSKREKDHSAIEGDKHLAANPYDWDVNKGNGMFLEHDKDAIPAGTKWDYARSNPYDHFAETFSMAFNTPGELHKDLVKGPGGDRDAAKAAWEAKVKAGDPTAADAEKDYLRKKEIAEERETQWKIMRKEVFHGDEAATKAHDEMEKLVGGDVAKLGPDFQDELDQCATPAQVDELKKKKIAELKANGTLPP